LFANTPNNVQWICSPAIRPYIESWVNSKWLTNNPRGERLVPIREPRFLTDLDALTLEEIEHDAYYSEFLRPIGFGWCVGTAIHSPCGDSLVFSIERKYHKGSVDRGTALLLDNLRPHLARSALLSARIGLERARATVDTLQAIGFPAAVHNGRAIVANERFATCEPAISIAAKDEVIFSNAALQAIFKDAFAALRLNSEGSLGRSIPLPARGEHPAMIAHLMPLRCGAPCALNSRPSSPRRACIVKQSWSVCLRCNRSAASNKKRATVPAAYINAPSAILCPHRQNAIDHRTGLAEIIRRIA
jgi:hypothetical protein